MKSVIGNWFLMMLYLFFIFNMVIGMILKFVVIGVNSVL